MNGEGRGREGRGGEKKKKEKKVLKKNSKMYQEVCPRL